MAWPESTKILPLLTTPRRIGQLATLTPKTPLTRPLAPLLREVWGPTADFGEEEEGGGGGSGDVTLSPRSALAVADITEPNVVTSVEDLTVKVGTATAEGPTPKVFIGPILSPTDRKTGFGLPFPNVVVVPERLGPARLSTVEREVLGVEE